MSTGPTRAKRKQSARELAERFGVSPRTIRRTVAQERADYLADAAARHERIRSLRAEGLSMRASARVRTAPLLLIAVALLGLVCTSVRPSAAADKPSQVSRSVTAKASSATAFTPHRLWAATR